MQQLLKELREGTTYFSNENGEEVLTRRPPTVKEMRAARAIEELIGVCQGLERANATLQHLLNQAQEELQTQYNKQN